MNTSSPATRSARSTKTSTAPLKANNAAERCRHSLQFADGGKKASSAMIRGGRQRLSAMTRAGQRTAPK
jgi:hypothetical protein